MSELKCPICGTPLEYETGYDGDYSCAKCGRAKMFGSEELWQALTDSMKEYDLCHDALVERTKELDRAHKENEDKQAVLNCVVDMLKTLNQKYTLIMGKDVIKETVRLLEQTKGGNNE